MTFPFKAILSDWAYTLVDLTGEDSKTAFRKVFAFLEEKGCDLPDFDEMYLSLNDDFHKNIAVSRKNHREACFEDVLESQLDHFKVNIESVVSIKEILEVYYKDIYSSRKVFPDVVYTLQALKNSGVRMGIVSNTTNPAFMKDYEKQMLGLDSFFEFSVYSSEVKWRKPHKFIFEFAINRLDLSPNQILFVGDDYNMDVIGAQGAGMQAAWLNRDNESLCETNYPEYVLTKFSDLLQLS
ncbi:MAG: HAD family hydrolase [Nitrospinales bacterium]